MNQKNDKINSFMEAISKWFNDNNIEDETKKEDNSSLETETKEEEKVEVDVRDKRIKELELMVETLKGTIESKDLIISQNSEQITALKELTSTDNPPIKELSLEEIISKGEF